MRSIIAGMGNLVRRGRPGARAVVLGAVAGAAALACVEAFADIYKFVDSRGRVHLADRPLGPGYVLIHRGPGYKPRTRPNDFARNRRRFAPLVDRVARHHRMDATLVQAVVQVESAYDPAAVSRKGAVGLMQLMPATAHRYGVPDRLDPERNLHGGVRYLRDLIVRFDDVVLALAAYNAGEKAVERYGNRIPPFPETQRFVNKVLSAWRRLREGQRGS